jgi:periplasmic copper chaperone A
MRVSRRAVALGLILAAAAQRAMANDTVTVVSAWARPAFAQTGMTALYLTIHNSATAPDELVGVETPIATQAELHETRLDNGIVSMRPVARLPLPAGGDLRLEPKGAHVMLMGFSQQLKVGDRFPVTLKFSTHPPITIEATVSMTPP